MSEVLQNDQEVNLEMESETEVRTVVQNGVAFKKVLRVSVRVPIKLTRIETHENYHAEKDLKTHFTS